MPDYLSCGSCPVDFELADIVGFIEHKRQRCIDGSTDNDQLECFKCSKKFHTPWPLLFHIQVDHQILIVRNFNQLSIPLSFKTSVIPLEQSDEPAGMETDVVELKKELNHRDIFTQTKRPRNKTLCCQPIKLPSCCQKVEPQCFEEPCHWPANVICTVNECFINHENQPNTETESSSTTCCACPQGTVKKESREVQTDFEYSDDVDINFLLSNSSNEIVRDFPDVSITGSTFSQQTTPFTTQEYPSNFPMSSDKNWGYYTQANSGHIGSHNNGSYLPNYDSMNYQMLMPNVRMQASTDQNYGSANSHLIVDPRQSLTPNRSPNHLNHTTDNHVFSLLNLCTTDQTLTNQTTLLHDSNAPFHYKPSPTNPDPQLIMQNHSPLHKEALSLFPRNENCSLAFIPSGSEMSADFNTENFDNDKLDNDRKEFKFDCTNCGKKFRQKVHLRKHVMSQHARLKPHKCSQCGYTTVEKSHLTVHIRTHTGERPYTCRRCSYSSAQNCTLKSHYLRRHPGDQIECTLCGSYFITEQERNNHQRSCRMVNGMPNGLNHNQSNDHKTA